MLKQYKIKDYGFRLVLWVIVLSILGIMVIGSADESYQMRQTMGLVLGAVMMMVVSLIDYKWILNFIWLIYIGGIGLLLAVQFFGEEVKGAQRWIEIAGIQFQPSDVEKIILILFFAYYFSKHEDDISKFKTIFLSLIFLGIPWILVKEQPDLSTSIVLILVFCAMFFIAGLSYKIIGGIIMVCIPAAIIFFSIITQPGQTLLEGYQLRRILAWLRPTEYAEEAYQQTNSIIAIGSGQLYGKGLDNNVVSSVKNGNFIAEPQTDFIFSVAGEELGFIGGCAIILLELLIAYECIRIGRKARDLTGTLICCGVAALIVFQSFMNICVATGLMPNTGIPLPFVSYGLTSLVSFFIGIGIVLNVGLQGKKY
ncbi:MAG: FtsW/RodA/SpoVE family cell cycle protein [Lachnospiraceae bacterium]|nr:rod shape-determining protein RodA [Robinsoniella sp.]MDY3765390.1 FtsW/RodA/SpoVE family cell cycle protein [Lachnospiraceae bacterium]